MCHPVLIKIQEFWIEVLQNRFEVKIIFSNFSYANIHTTDSLSIVLATTVCVYYTCSCSKNIHANCMVIDFDGALKNVVPTINNHKETAEVKRCGIHTPFLQMLVHGKAYAPSKVQDISIYHTTNHHCTRRC